MIRFKFLCKWRGGYVHMRVFSGVWAQTLAKCGDLCMTTEEFNAFRDTMLDYANKRPGGVTRFEFEQED